MVNQLLTEMDGFRKEELVFVVGTTNFVESLDPALLRPGRFEFALHIPYPNAEDRRAILAVHDKRLGLEMTDAGDRLRGASAPTSSCRVRAAARTTPAITSRRCAASSRARGCARPTQGPTEPATIDTAIEQYLDRPKLTTDEELVVATHEAGHAVTALVCKHAPPIDRISIRGDIGGALGYVKHARSGASLRRHVRAAARSDLHAVRRPRGRGADLLDDISIGSSAAICTHATQIARALVEQYGDGGDEIGVGRWRARHATCRCRESRARRDRRSRSGKILERERKRARGRSSSKHKPLLRRAARPAAREEGARPRVVRAPHDYRGPPMA